MKIVVTKHVDIELDLDELSNQLDFDDIQYMLRKMNVRKGVFCDYDRDEVIGMITDAYPYMKRVIEHILKDGDSLGNAIDLEERLQINSVLT